MFYPHTIKGKPFPRLDLIANPPEPPEPLLFVTPTLNGINQYFSAGDKFNIGTANFSYCAFFKTSSLTPMNILSKSTFTDQYNYLRLVNGRVHFTLFAGSANRLDVTTDLSYNDGDWHSLVVYIDRSSPSVSFHVDGVSVASSLTGVNQGDVSLPSNNTAEFQVGSRENIPEFPFIGSIAFTGVALGEDLTTFANEFHNNADPICWSSMSTDLKNKFITSGEFWELTEWAGHTGQSLNGQANSNDLVNNGSAPFTDNGINVDCT